MPDQPTDPKPPGRPGGVAAVERAAGDFRRGVAVVVAGDGGAALFAMPAELATDTTLAGFRARPGTPEIVLTHKRAATLKIRLYTPEVVRVPLPADMDASTVRSLADPTGDLSHPMRGPFAARRDGVTDAYIAAAKLAKIAALLPAVLVVRLPPAEAETIVRSGAAIAVRAADIFAYDRDTAVTLAQVAAARVPLQGAENSRILAFRPSDGGVEHLAIVIGDPVPHEPVLARLHSECFTGDLLGSLKCDCGQQLRGAIEEIAARGAGVLLYLAQEGRGIGLINKLRAYALQDQGFDTVEANERLGFEADERVFQPAAEMLKKLGFSAVRLMTNNPDKVAALQGLGITVVERVPHKFPSNRHNELYLRIKAEKTGHLL